MGIIERIHPSLRVQSEPFNFWTAVEDEEIFRYFLAKASPFDKALEIGTCRGLSAALIAEYAKVHVSTFDVLTFSGDTPQRIWKDLKVGQKIKSYVRTSSFTKKELIDSLEFDFVFVDGGHLYESVEFDFSLVKRCSKILWHDYRDDWPDVKIFLAKLLKEDKEWNIEVKAPFAYTWK